RTRQRRQRREAFQEFAVLEQHARDLRLLEHQLRHQDPIWIARPPPWKIAMVRAIPRPQQTPEPQSDRRRPYQCRAATRSIARVGSSSRHCPLRHDARRTLRWSAHADLHPSRWTSPVALSRNLRDTHRVFNDRGARHAALFRTATAVHHSILRSAPLASQPTQRRDGLARARSTYVTWPSHL